MSEHQVAVPDIGSDEKVDVVEILVVAGQEIAVEDGLITLESDKATMDVPTPTAGVVRKILVRVGDKVGEGDPILLLEVDDEEAAAELADTPPSLPAEVREAQVVAEPVTAEADPTAGDNRGPDERCEVLVLGSGPGGYTAAFRAADLGKKVILVERYLELGGVCLNVGCIPSKALLHIGRVIDEAADAEAHGVKFGKPEIDLDKVRAWKDQVVKRLTGGIAKMAEQRKVQVVGGVGRFLDSSHLEVVTTDGAVTVEFESAIIAAGSRVVEIPGIPYGDERVMDSTDALEIPEVPKRMLVIGGGIIGLEMATVYGALGAEVTVVELLDGLIPGCDRDLVRPLERRLKKRYGAKIHVGTRVARVAPGEDGLEAFLEGPRAPKSVLFDRVLVCVGRRPNGDRLALEAAGVNADERGFIQVDRQQRTNVPNIFAIGDIVGQPLLAHKASHEGKVAAEVAAGLKSSFDARVIPSVAYTDPEVAWVGLTETEAKDQGIPYEKGSFPWAASGRALGMGRQDGLTKILFDPESHRVLGAGVVGSGAGDLISELALAIEMDCEAGDLALTIHPHPTLSETVAFAAEVFEGTITDLYLPKKR